MDKRFLLIMLMQGFAVASGDFGVIVNAGQYQNELSQVQSAGGFGAMGTEAEYNILQVKFSGEKFSVKFDDQAANALATNSPNRSSCPQVERTKDLRTLMIGGIVAKHGQGTLKIAREGTAGAYKALDTWLYASKAGKIAGKCIGSGLAVTYNLNLAQGWNVIRVYSSEIKSVTIVENISGKPIAWQVQK